MQVIALHPKRGQIMAQALAVAALALAALWRPALALPCAALAPLFVCPLIGNRGGLWALAAALAPAVISLASGLDALYSASLALPCVTTALVTAWQRRAGRDTSPKAFVWHIAAYAASLSLIAVCGARALGGDIARGLSNAVAASLRNAPGSTWYRLAASGLVSLPAEYRGAGLLVFALDPALRSQMQLSLGLTLRLAIGAAVPGLFVQACVAGGLFSSLRAQKLNRTSLETRPPTTSADPGETRMVCPNAFRTLELPREWRAAALMMAAAWLTLSGAADPTLRMLGTLCRESLTFGFALLGAAVIVCALSSRRPGSAALYGALAAALCVAFPTAAFLIGLIDQPLHLRAKILDKQKEESP